MSKTQENLQKAITGESLARAKYTMFASRARKEGLESIARVFEETADNEFEHSKRLLQFVKGDTDTTTPIDLKPVSTTTENLKEAIEGEDHETTEMYKDFEKQARKEDLEEIADIFKNIGEVEEKHRDRYKSILKHIEEGTVFKRSKEIEWKCLNCGYVHKGKEAPQVCPACAHPQSWYEPRSESWLG